MTDDGARFSTDSLLCTYGWSQTRGAEFAALCASQPKLILEPGRIVFDSHALYRVVTARGELAAHLGGGLRREGETPVVGDWVAVAVKPDGAVVAESISRGICGCPRPSHQTSKRRGTLELEGRWLELDLRSQLR